MKVLSQVEGCTVLLLKTAARNQKIDNSSNQNNVITCSFYHSFPGKKAIIKSHYKNNSNKAHAIKLTTTLTAYLPASKRLVAG
jgi:hypothetical protein